MTNKETNRHSILSRDISGTFKTVFWWEEYCAPRGDFVRLPYPVLSVTYPIFWSFLSGYLIKINLLKMFYFSATTWNLVAKKFVCIMVYCVFIMYYSYVLYIMSFRYACCLFSWSFEMLTICYSYVIVMVNYFYLILMI